MRELNPIHHSHTHMHKALLSKELYAYGKSSIKEPYHLIMCKLIPIHHSHTRAHPTHNTCTQTNTPTPTHHTPTHPHTHTLTHGVEGHNTAGALSSDKENPNSNPSQSHAQPTQHLHTPSVPLTHRPTTPHTHTLTNGVERHYTRVPYHLIMRKPIPIHHSHPQRATAARVNSHVGGPGEAHAKSGSHSRAVPNMWDIDMTHMWDMNTTMGWLRFVGSFKL